ncbi:MAG: HD domain-containing protein [Bacilli bacterium]
MKSSRIMKIFEQYVRGYDMNNINIKAKYFHSLKVMEIAKELASSLDFFTEEDVAVCEFIALFHEIGSFSKTPDYHIDGDNEDSYEKTIDVLFNKKLIREITKDNKYDNVIKMAIYAYEKNGFPDGIDNKTKHICAIIKDAHNLDSFRVFVNYPYVDTRINSYPNNLIYEDFKKFKTISPRMSENSSDTVLVVLSKMYSFNYKYSYYLLKQNNYITKVIDCLTFENKEIENFFKQLVVVLNNYVDKRIGVLYAR